MALFREILDFSWRWTITEIVWSRKTACCLSLWELQTLSFLKRFLRSELLDENTTPRKLILMDLNNEKNILPAIPVKVEFGTRKILNKLSIVQAIDYWDFYQNAREFLLQFVEKPYERCPLKYPLARALS